MLSRVSIADGESRRAGWLFMPIPLGPAQVWLGGRLCGLPCLWGCMRRFVRYDDCSDDG